jgi:hypothetical protein
LDEVEKVFEGVLEKDEMVPFVNYYAPYTSPDYPKEFIALKMLHQTVVHACRNIANLRRVEIFKKSDQKIGGLVVPYLNTSLQKLRKLIWEVPAMKKLVFQFFDKKGQMIDKKQESQMTLDKIQTRKLQGGYGYHCIKVAVFN